MNDTIKIVINTCCGGFGLSRKAIQAINARRKVKGLEPIDKYYSEDRLDEDLIAVVEELGAKAASSTYARLKVVEIPADVDWELEDHDGAETIRERGRSWC